MSYRKFTSTLLLSVVLLAAQLQASVSGLDLADGATSKSNFAVDVTSDLSWYQAADEIKNQLLQNNKNLGYLGSKVDIHSSTLQILWKSPVPDDISKMKKRASMV
jgi:hypothetical protein